MYRKSFTFDGRRYYVRADSPEELIEKVTRKKADLEHDKRCISRNMKVEDWIEEWMTVYKEPIVSDGWLKNIRSMMDSCVITEIGKMRLKDVRPTHLQRILNAKSDCSASYIKKLAVLLDELFEQALCNDLVLKNPAKSLSRPQGTPQKDRRSITDIERAAILDFCEHHWSGLFLKLQLFCGFRPSEAAALTWSDVDLASDPPRINISKSAKFDGQVGAPKSKAGYRSVPIPDELLPDLSAPGANPFGYVCLNKSGRMIRPDTFKSVWKVARHHMNVFMGCRTFRNELVPPYPLADDFTMYCLRHTYCTDLEKAGVPINVASRLMGHSSLELTAKIYTHDSEEVFASAAKKINKIAR